MTNTKQCVGEQRWKTFDFYVNLYLFIYNILNKSVRISQETEAQRVAEHTSARDYFLGEEEKAIEEWAERAKKIFEYAIENLDLPGTF